MSANEVMASPVATPAAASASRRPDASRWAHRKTCILAGALTVVGGLLALLVHPAFAALSALGGLWLIVAPEPTSRQ